MSSVKVIIKEVKNITRACDACKRRRGKCDGLLPCSWCTVKDQNCVYTAPQKRGPKRKLDGDVLIEVEKASTGMSIDFELAKYFEIYMKFLDPFFTMFSTEKSPSNMSSPKSYSQFSVKYSACAFIARVSGNKERSLQLIAEARNFASKCFDAPSVDGVIGFLLLSVFWAGLNSNLCKHYANISLSMFSSLGSSYVIPSHFRYISTVGAITLSNAIPMEDRVRTLLHTTNTIPLETNLQRLFAVSFRLSNKLYSCVAWDFEARWDALAAINCHISYSEEQRQSLLKELRIIKLCTASAKSEIVNMTDFLFVIHNCLEIFVEWRSGHADVALPLALETVNRINVEAYKLGCIGQCNMMNLFTLMIFLYEQGKYAEADKVYRIVSDIHSTFEESSSSEIASRYLSEFVKHHHSVPVFRPLSCPQSPTALPHDISASLCSTYIKELYCYLCKLQPARILNPHSLHLLYTSLGQLVPPCLAPSYVFEPTNISSQTTKTTFTDPDIVYNFISNTISDLVITPTINDPIYSARHACSTRNNSNDTFPHTSNPTLMPFSTAPSTNFFSHSDPTPPLNPANGIPEDNICSLLFGDLGDESGMRILTFGTVDYPHKSLKCMN